MPKCIIFDCDGTLVDSEDVTNRIIAEMAGELGITMSGAEATAIFGGTTIDEVLYKMRELSGNEVPDDWLGRLIKNVSQAWKKFKSSEDELYISLNKKRKKLGLPPIEY